MKKLLITFAVLGTILLCSGLALALVFGGYSDDVFNHFNGSDVIAAETTLVYTDYTEVPENEPNINDSYYHEYSNYSDLKEICFDVTSADVFIGYYAYQDTLSVSGNVNSILFEESYKDGTLKIEYADASNFGIWDSNEPVTIYVYLPVECVDKIDMDIVNGEVSINYCTVNELDVELVAGNVNIYEAKILDNSDIEIMSGEIYVNYSVLNNTKISKSQGSLSVYDSDLKGETNIESVAGKTYLELNGILRDYDFDIEKISGNIYLNYDNIIPADNPDAPNKIKINQTTGDIYININI